MKTKQSAKFTKAQKRVGDMKKFYHHLRVFLVVNILLYLAKFMLIDFFKDQGIQGEGFYSWLEWNAIIWGLGLILHGFYVFILQSKSWEELKPSFIKN